MTTRTRFAALTGTLAAGALAAGLLALPGGPASAAAVTVDDARLTWAVNDEVNAAAFEPGAWNLLSAGRIGDPTEGGQKLNGDGSAWTNGKPAGWRAQAGDVLVEDLQADGSYAPATFEGTRRDSNGAPTTSGANARLAQTRLALSHGTGTLDAAGDDADLRWSGEATVLFYSGRTFFTLADPHLVVTDGAAVLSASISGYATSMDDAEKWETLTPTLVTLATASGVDVTADGLTGAADYLGRRYAAPAGGTAQSTTSASYGSFPQSFVDYQQQIGSGPYWYSTGGTADYRKPAKPFTVAWSAPTPTTSETPAATPSPSPAPTTSAPAVTAPVPAPAAPAAPAVQSASTTSVRVTTRPKARPRKRAGLAVVTITGAGGGTARAVVVAAKGARTVKTLAPVAATGTARRVTLPTLKPGRYALVVTYPGTGSVAGSSATARFVVR